MRKQEIIAQKLHVFRTFAYFVCLNCCAVTVHIETDKTTTKIKNERPNQVQGVCVCVSVYVLLIYFRVPSRCSKLLIYLCCVLCVCASISSFFFSFAVFLFSPHSLVPIFSNRYTVRSVHSVCVFALRYYKISFSMDYTKTRARRKRHTFFVGRVNKVFFSTWWWFLVRVLCVHHVPVCFVSKFEFGKTIVFFSLSLDLDRIFNSVAKKRNLRKKHCNSFWTENCVCRNSICLRSVNFKLILSYTIPFCQSERSSWVSSF